MKGAPLWRGALFLLFLTSCHNTQTKNHRDKFVPCISSFKTVIRSGDLILRNGTDAISRAARGFNRTDTSYSHCGLLQVENDSIFVYHALGGGYNPSQHLMRQPLENFCNPEENNKIAIYRYTLSDDQSKKLKAVIKKYYLAGLPFDVFFNFSTDDKMYCSEFVFKSLNEALDGSLISLLKTDQDPVYITIDDLYLNEKAVFIRRISRD